MHRLYIDCQAGISGDMAVGAMIDIGVPLEHIKKELARLSLPHGSYSISVVPVQKKGVRALKFDVSAHDTHNHRHYAEIDRLIANSALNERVKTVGRKIFRVLAEAEAEVHGVDISKVHFHEVGAIDSIVDIIATAICIDYLDVCEVMASSLPFGSGFVKTDHGLLPVPAPATALLMKGMRLHARLGTGERVTPTGAAILAGLDADFSDSGSFIPLKSGSGAGTMDFEDTPNIVRVFLAACDKTTGYEEVVEACTNIDDTTPEVISYLLQLLMEKGALDAWVQQAQMKKGRSGFIFSFLCSAGDFSGLSGIVMRETGTLGVRFVKMNRVVQQRKSSSVMTSSGIVRFKESEFTLKPEYDDCAAIAKSSDLPLKDVIAQLFDEKKSAELHGKACELAKILTERGECVATAESCTAGLISAAITSVPGSSAYFKAGFATYSNSAKSNLLGVPESMINTFGAVSNCVAEAMANGARNRGEADYAIAVTGIAGPDGGTPDKPVGTVYIAVSAPSGVTSLRQQFTGDRDEIRKKSTLAALEMLLATIEQERIVC